MASITKRTAKDGTPSWLVRIRLRVDGDVIKENKTFSGKHYKKRDALAWSLKRERELLDGGVMATEVVQAQTLAKLTERYIDEFEALSNWSKSKASDLRRLVKYDIAKRPAVALKSADYLDHIRFRLNSGVMPQTANNDLIWWRIILKTARAAWGIPISIDPLDDAAMMARMHGMVAKSAERDRRPDLEELDRLMSYFSESRGLTPMIDIVPFQIFSARRISETTRLLWSELDEQLAVAKVRKMKDPRRKLNDVRVGLTDEALAIIRRQPRTDERVFPYNPRTVGSLFNKACKVVGVEDLRLHDLRHEGTSWLFEQGFDIPQVAHVTGHRSWANLKRYTHLTQKEPFDKYAGWKWKRGVLQAVG